MKLILKFYIVILFLSNNFKIVYLLD